MLKILLVVAMLCVIWWLLIPRTAISDYEPVIEVIPEKPDIKTYSALKVQEVFGDGQWFYFNFIISKESSWNHLAKNPNSSAYGLGQLLSGTLKYVGCVKSDDPYYQIDCTITYISKRYKDPHRAYHFWQQNSWY